MYYVDKQNQNLFVYDVKLEREKILELRKKICEKYSRVVHHNVVITPNGIGMLDYYKMKISTNSDAFSSIGHNRDIYTGEDTVYIRSSYEDVSYDEIINPEIVLLIDGLLSGDNIALNKILHISHITRIREKKFIPYYLELSKYIKFNLIDTINRGIDDDNYDLGYNYQNCNSMVERGISTYKRRIKNK